MHGTPDHALDSIAVIVSILLSSASLTFLLFLDYVVPPTCQLGRCH
jgi:hypothetical protein